MAIFSFKNSLLYRWIVFNAVGAALIVAAVYQGWIQSALHVETLYITHAIMALFALAMCYVTYRVVEVNRDLGRISELREEYKDDVSRVGINFKDDIKDALEISLSSKTAILPTIEKILVISGVLGTVVGMIFAFLAVPHGSSFSPDKVGDIVSVILTGMSQGLYRTLIGGIGAVWIMLNAHMLGTAYAELMVRILSNKVD